MFQTAQRNWLEAITDEMVESAILQIVDSIEFIIWMWVIRQLSTEEEMEKWGEFSFSPQTSLEKETLAFVHQEVWQMSDQMILTSLIRDLMTQDEQHMLNSIIDAYNNMSEEDFMLFINSLNMAEIMKDGVILFSIISLVKTWAHPMTAIKEILVEYELNPNDKSVRESVAIPREINSFLHDFNQILLSHIYPESKSFFATELSCAIN